MAAAGERNWQGLAGSLRISQNELFDFHQSHFSADAVVSFSSDFLNLKDKQEAVDYHTEGDWEGEVDDGLGYYEDGVKRTLTDEQIEIFRHSELRDLERQQERPKPPKSIGNSGNMTGESQVSSTDHKAVNHATRNSKKKKKKTRNDKQEKPKPDLRKRTWDVVDAGLDSLDYD